MITEDYVSFETAKLLKEKGFQAKCTACYRSDPSHTLKLVSGRINYCNPRFSKYKMIPPYNAPTTQMAMKWLREVHNLWCEISWEGKGLWCMEVFSLVDKEFIPGSIVHEIKSYEEACEAAIKYCLENLI